MRLSRLALSLGALADRACCDTHSGLAPNGETGLVMSGLSEKDFVARCMSSVRPGATLSVAAAKAFYLHLWKVTGAHPLRNASVIG